MEKIKLRRRRMQDADKQVLMRPLLDVALTGLHSTDPRICAAAESVLSYLVGRLNSKSVVIPEELLTRVNLLLTEVQK